MKTLTKAFGVSLLTLSCFSMAESGGYMSEHVENGLIRICKSAAMDKSIHMNKNIRALRLKTKTVALNVVCNGEDIITFAEGYGATKTTAKLSRSIGSVSVTDIAAKRHFDLDVSFDME